MPNLGYFWPSSNPIPPFSEIFQDPNLGLHLSRHQGGIDLSYDLGLKILVYGCKAC